MTESIVRSGEDSWVVYIDGFYVGDLFSNLDDSGWPVSYHYTIGLYVGNAYATLAEAEMHLVQTYKQHLSL